jgi:hypothetical protein
MIHKKAYGEIDRVVRSGLCGLLILTLLASLLVFTGGALSAASSTLYFRTITINPGTVPTAQTDFPLLVSISNNSLKSIANGGHVANADGSDIYFTDSSGAVSYAFEIENYSPSSGVLTAWVKVPSLAVGSVINLYYGGGAVTHTPAEVWSNGYQAVWHMNQVNALDSTAHANQGTAHGSTTPPAVAVIDGHIAGADNFTPGTTYIDCGNNSSLYFSGSGSYTWETWINPAEFHSGGSGIIGKEPGTGHEYFGYDISLGGNGSGGGGGGGGGGSVAGPLRFQTTSGSTTNGTVISSVGIALNTWTHIAATYSYSSRDDNYTYGSVLLYINGIQDSASGTVATHDDTSSPLILGWKQNANSQSSVYSHFKGGMDEIEFSGRLRSADWILTGYRNQNNPGSFYSLGVETPAPPALKADTTKITTGQAIDITFADDAVWRAAITAVSLDGTALNSGQYTINSADITILAGVINTAGSHAIVVKAAGYPDALVTQSIVTKGDVNNDGVINIQDVVITVNFALGKSTPTVAQFSAADYNADSNINIQDIVLIVNKALGR